MAKVRQGKCTPEVIRKVCILIMEGVIWSKIAEVVEISTRTFERWRDPKSPLYEKEFAKAVDKALIQYDITPVKARQFEESKKHKLVKRVKEPMLIDSRTKKSKTKRPPPKMPPSNCRKDYLIKYAREKLGLRLNKKLTVPNMRIKCRERIEELTEEVMVVKREYEQEVDSNPRAVENVMKNCGPEDERWKVAQELDLGGKVLLLPPKITKHEEDENENGAT